MALALLALAGAVSIGITYAVTAGRERALADTATQACADGAVAPSPDGLALCDQAAQVQADPIPGAIGAVGPAGRGVLGTAIVDGRLIVSYTDGTSTDVGQVVGATGQLGPPGGLGPPGALGPEGIGISASTIEDGQLVITYSDGRRTDVGTVVGPLGPPGRGIAGTAAVDGRLIVTYTDGSTEDAGPLPAGPPGAQGPGGAPAPSVQSVTRTYSDGSVERCTRSGGPDSDPELACEITDPSPPPQTPPTATQPEPPPLVEDPP